MRRVLFTERISDDRNEKSDSIESQHDKLSRRAETEGVTVVGTAVDLSVSGDVDPFQRKSLGPWLADENLSKWDELWVSTQDRLSRDNKHFLLFVFWAIEHNKIVQVMDDPGFNEQMHTETGLLLLHAKALGPAMELKRIKVRTKDSHERRRFTTRWTGGIPPFGYRPVARYVDGKTATYLEQDPAMVKVLQEMRRQILAGQSFFSVAKALNEKGERTARDRARIRKGKPVHRRGAAEGVPEQWSETTIKSLLSDPALLGSKKHKGEVLYDSQGQPVRVADPIFTDDEWQALQAAVEARTRTTVRRVNGTSPLYGVVYCGECGSKAVHKSSYHNPSGVTYRYYGCGAWPKEIRCRGISVRAEEAEDFIEIEFLQRYGMEPVTEKVWVPGSDNTKELEVIKARLDRLRRDSAAGVWDDDQDGFRNLLHSLRTRRDELSAEPVVEGHWTEKATGQTFQELWSGLDLDGQRQQLIKSGYKVLVGRKTFTITPEPELWPEKKARLESLGYVLKDRQWVLPNSFNTTGE
ncbi:recombinase family protein [Streptomyces laculatispora]|uniref:Recombinase family protein n=1 Tax=Streptomyces laculatispora TaxID=887464 RepID=A0ABY9IE46_9ACTN|nr:recombinase family protein [Streptomyces laculatispora]WLQ44869.1 recombinase family protein [Streptomyces laculatispora]